MKILAFTALVAHLIFTPANVTAQVTNQNLYDTVPNMVEHYKKRVAGFEKEPIVTGKVMFLGNSITEGGNWAQLTGDKTVINRGVSGDVTFGVINRLNDIIIRKPSKLFILIGINDISKDFPEKVIADNYRRIIETIKSKSPDTKIFVQSLLPLNPEVSRFPQHFDKADHVIVVNRLLKELAAAQQVTFIDLNPVFKDERHLLNAKYTYDGLHLNEEGYKVWVAFLKENNYL